MSDAQDQPKYYTVEEANAMVGQLRDLFGLVIQLRGQLGALYQRLDAAGYPPRDEDIDDDLEQPPASLPSDVVRDQAWFRGLVETLREKLEEIQACGCVIKDVEAGLVDWLARHDGRDVYLCWKLGEPAVAWYHDIDAGFAGRRPLP